MGVCVGGWVGERETEGGREGGREGERERERERDRQTDRQTETDRDRQTDRQTGQIGTDKWNTSETGECWRNLRGVWMSAGKPVTRTARQPAGGGGIDRQQCLHGPLPGCGPLCTVGGDR